MTPPSVGPPTIPDHELLRRIGDGSYGEVWLARNVTGTLRAVKVVHRTSFVDERPYEREFIGLKNFEPVSRAHDGFVDILQIGRKDAAGFFYYVMELADDREQRLEAGPLTADVRPPPSDIRLYSPLTLEARIRAEGRMPVKDCVAIGAGLADALGHLHAAGLVHRDIKPSNIIFVGGVPKLADVGLVARLDSVRSFVGTEGFVPAEGPGTPRADIYSLGKCLYEMAMGKDRQAFPSPPTLLDELPDRAALLELNEVITRACDPEPARRYRCAAELAAELNLLRAGQSVQHARRSRKRRKIALGVAAGLALVAVIWTGAWLLQRPKLEIVREFTMPGNWPAHSAKLGHYSGSASAELFLAANGSIAVVTLEGVAHAPTVPVGIKSDQFELQLLADSNGDGRDEALVSWREGTNLHVSVFNQHLREVRRFDAAGSLEQGEIGPYPISSLVALGFVPAAAGRPPSLLASLETGRKALWPRAVRLYNFTNQTLVWETNFPSMAVHKVAVLPEGRSPCRFVVGTQSHDNGAEMSDGTDDNHSYLYGLSAEGKRLWTIVAGPELTQTAPELVTADGTNCIFATVSRQFESFVQAGDAATNTWQAQVLKFNLEGRELVPRFNTSSAILSLAVADLKGGGTPVLLAPCADGSLLVLDTELHLLRQVPVITKRHNWVELRIVQVLDLDRDNEPEVVLSGRQIEFVSGTNTSDPQGDANVRRWPENSVVVLDHKLKPLARRVIHARAEQMGFEVLVATNQPDGNAAILALDQQVSVLRFRRR